LCFIMHMLGMSVLQIKWQLAVNERCQYVVIFTSTGSKSDLGTETGTPGKSLMLCNLAGIACI
jgi:hypothetical protein